MDIFHYLSHLDSELEPKNKESSGLPSLYFNFSIFMMTIHILDFLVDFILNILIERILISKKPYFRYRFNAICHMLLFR